MEKTGKDLRVTGPADSVDSPVTIATAPETEARLRDLLERKGAAIRVRLDAPPDSDVIGHDASVAAVTLTVLEDDDDTEGHAISLHFPTAEEAKRFQQRILLSGALVGTLVVAGTGLALSQGAPSIGAAAGSGATEVSALGSQSWADPGYGSDVAAATGAVTSGGQAASDVGYASEASTPTAGSQAWADHAASASSAATGEATSGGQAAADVAYGSEASAATPGSQAWADPAMGGPSSAATGDATTGGQAAADPDYASEPAPPNEAERPGTHPR